MLLSGHLSTDSVNEKSLFIMWSVDIRGGTILETVGGETESQY